MSNSALSDAEKSSQLRMMSLSDLISVADGAARIVRIGPKLGGGMLLSAVDGTIKLDFCVDMEPRFAWLCTCEQGLWSFANFSERNFSLSVGSAKTEGVLQSDYNISLSEQDHNWLLYASEQGFRIRDAYHKAGWLTAEGGQALLKRRTSDVTTGAYWAIEVLESNRL